MSEGALQLELLTDPVFVEAATSGSRDYVALIEAAYDLASDDATWMLGLMRAASPLLDRGLGVIGFFWDLSKPGRQRISHNTYVGCPPAIHEAAKFSAATMTAAEARALYLEGHPCKWINSQTGQFAPRAYSEYRRRIESEGFLHLACADLNGAGCSIVAAYRGGRPTSTGLGRTLDRIARHLVAGMRLRGALRGHSIDVADAVLDSRGSLLHAEPCASGPRELVSLVNGARRMLDSRQARRSRPEQAVDLWRALVLGRWSIIDHCDSDGKRFLLARHNPPDAREPTALTEGERRAAALFALLGSVKLVAYELGLAPSSVSDELKSACRKLGCRDRSELAFVLRPEQVSDPSDGGANRAPGKRHGEVS